MAMYDRLQERNKRILSDFKKARKNLTIKEALEKVANKYFLSVSSINQIVYNPKRNHSPHAHEAKKVPDLQSNCNSGNYK